MTKLAQLWDRWQQAQAPLTGISRHIPTDDKLKLALLWSIEDSLGAIADAVTCLAYGTAVGLPQPAREKILDNLPPLD